MRDDLEGMAAVRKTFQSQWAARKNEAGKPMVFLLRLVNLLTWHDRFGNLQQGDLEIQLLHDAKSTLARGMPQMECGGPT